MTNYQCRINAFKKYFNYKLQNTFLKCISITFVNYFGQVAQNTKFKILLTKVIEIHSGVIASQSVNQSMNSRLKNKRNINIFIGLVLAPYFKRVIYNIGPRVHGFQLEPLLRMTETLFLASYTKTYTNCFDRLVAMFSPCIVRRCNRFTCNIFEITVAFCHL